MKDLWDQFNLKPNSSIEEIDKAYLRLRSQTKGDHKELHLHWKILRDPYTVIAYNHYHTVRSIIEAGYFDDGVEPEDKKPERDNLNWLTTPFHKIINNLMDLDQATKESFQSQPPIVLLSTGAFSPVHQGHLMMMENAKKELEKRGRTVLGGYISPSHDEYVFHKYKDVQCLDAPHRLRLCEKAVFDSDWLMVDSWEARYNDVPVPYTEIIDRLELYLNNILDLPFHISIFYVFGGDNAPFARLFIKKGGCVCVKRPIHEDRLLTINHDNLITTNNNILIVDAFFDQPRISSTEVRNGTAPGLHSIEELLHKWLFCDTKQINSKIEYNYAIRDDSTWATRTWSKKCTPEDLTIAGINFVGSLRSSIQESFLKCNTPDMPLSVYPFLINLNEQQSLVTEIDRKTPTINIDPCTFSNIKINISRLFGLSDGQTKSNRLIPRPGYKPIPEQFSQIKSGDYIIIDDDIATGYTINTLLNISPPKIIAKEKIGLLQKYMEKHRQELNPNNEREFLDVVDSRDFLVGSDSSGLVVMLPNGDIARAPYTLPYVSLVSRAMIPPSMELSLSIKIWQQNIVFHQSLKSKILLEDCDLSFQKLMKCIGFKEKDSLLNICQWHLDYLRKLTFK